jgi:DNA polymerase-4
MDCFYAAVEMREDPLLVGKPIAVGGSAESRRGVLCTCNYEARKFGVRSAMPVFIALQKCPNLMVLPVRFDLYRRVSHQIREIFYRYTDLVEPLSLDEAYLDVSHQDRYATELAREIRAEILKETGLTASAGIAANKFLAKIASDWRKPNGQYTITPEMQEDFLKELPIEKIWGVGKVTARKLHDMGIHTCKDLQGREQAELVLSFGSFGVELYQLARGIDPREVISDRKRKSLSNERTFPEDFSNIQSCLEQIPELFEDLQNDLTRGQYQRKDLKKVFLKLKFDDFSTTTAEAILCEELSAKLYFPLLDTAWGRSDGRGVRLIGIGVRFHEEEGNSGPVQLELFSEEIFQR